MVSCTTSLSHCDYVLQSCADDTFLRLYSMYFPCTHHGHLRQYLTSLGELPHRPHISCFVTNLPCHPQSSQLPISPHFLSDICSSSSAMSLYLLKIAIVLVRGVISVCEGFEEGLRTISVSSVHEKIEREKGYHTASHWSSQLGCSLSIAGQTMRSSRL